GASRGIGAATARLAAKEDARIVVNYNKSKSAAQKVVEEIKTEGGEAIAIQADVADRKQTEMMIHQVVKKWKRIDVLINNAGVLAYKEFNQTTPEEIDWQIDVNLRGLTHLTHSILPIMKKQKNGVIVNISSGAGKKGEGIMAVYSATKFAVIGFTQGLAQEIINDSIRVYAVCPGQTATEMGDYAGMPPEKVAQRIIECAKENLGLSPGQDSEIYW
ncbi:SDR family oxidoreductase, partial [Candidatus Microgenomates bacterium]|nr:SDR family oxidoreductase [Candidatus Microgenomates bacterium]